MNTSAQSAFDFEAHAIDGTPSLVVGPARLRAADRQHRQCLRLHAAVRRTRGTVENLRRARADGDRLPVQPVRLAGPGQRHGDRRVLPEELRRQLSDDEQGRRQRPHAHPLWKWLCAEAPGLLGTKAIKWNFTKFLVGRDGQVIKRYAPTDTPASLKSDIEAALSA